MKKLFTLLLALIMCLSLASCGSDDKSDSGNEVQEQDGMRKEIVYTNADLGITGETGPFKYTIEGIQVSKLTATDDETAEFLGVEKNKEVTAVVINASAENTSDATNSFYIGQATLTSSTKEQVESDMWLSEHIEGEFLGQVKNSGSLAYILKNTNADELTSVTLHINAPSNENWENIGEDVVVDIPIGK